MRARVTLGGGDSADRIPVIERLGEDWFVAVVDSFYDGVAEDSRLRPLYVDPDPELGGARTDLAEFLIQYFGGPSTYSDRKGHPRLRARHIRFSIGSSERDAWLEHMLAAIAANPGDDEARSEVVEYVRQAAEFLRMHE